MMSLHTDFRTHSCIPDTRSQLQYLIRQACAWQGKFGSRMTTISKKCSKQFSDIKRKTLTYFFPIETDLLRVSLIAFAAHYAVPVLTYRYGKPNLFEEIFDVFLSFRAGRAVLHVSFYKQTQQWIPRCLLSSASTSYVSTSFRSDHQAVLW